MSILTNEHEELKLSDVNKYQIPNDKIRIYDEPYESFFMVFNRKDAEIFKKEYNRLAKRVLNLTFPIACRRFIQNGVFYDIYEHRWCVNINGKLTDTYQMEIFKSKKWKLFKYLVNRRLGKIYILN